MRKTSPNSSPAQPQLAQARATQARASKSPVQKIWCDFNACGLSGEDDDFCFYSFDRHVFYELPPESGLRVLIWDYSDEEEIIAFEATLEPFPDHVTGWRARPDENKFYRGPILEGCVMGKAAKPESR
jgi:hypothetical protein